MASSRHARIGAVVVSAVALLMAGFTAPSATARPMTTHPSERVVAQTAAVRVLSPRLRVAPARPIRRELFTVSGRLPTHFKRPVTLRMKKQARWVNVQRARTTATGRFHFGKLRTNKRAIYSVVAPRVKSNKSITTRSKRVRPVSQAARISALPRVAQRGGAPAASSGASAVVAASFTPARARRVVLLQRNDAGTWTTIANAKQNAFGAVRFAIGSSAADYRVIAKARNGAAAITSASDNSGGWTEDFTEEFVRCEPIPVLQVCDRGLKANVWEFRSLGVYSAASKRTRSASDKRSVDVKDGTLQLTMMRNPDRRTKFMNGHIGTQSSYDFTYGVAAARVKFNEGAGMHGSFWMQTPKGKTAPGNPAVAGAEIDVAEFFGRDLYKNRMAHFLHYYTANKTDKKLGGVMPSTKSALGRGDAWWKNYHVFSVEWDPRGYVFRIDGFETWRTGKSLSKTDEFLVLSLLSSDYELKHLDSGENKTMFVDWVKVWQ